MFDQLGSKVGEELFYNYRSKMSIADQKGKEHANKLARKSATATATDGVI